MKNSIYLFLCVFLFLNLSSCNSNKIKISDIDILGIWYPQKPNSNNRIRINEKLFISEGIVDIEKFKDGNTVRFEVKDTIKVIEFIKNKENQNSISLILARQKDEKIQYNSFLFSQTEIKGIITIFAATNSSFETVEEAKKGMTEAKFKNVKQELFFSEEYTQKVFPTLKPMEEITKQDYITVVKYVRSFEDELKEFIIEKFGKEDEYIAYEMKEVAQQLANKKLYFLGYDPKNLPQNGESYLKKFEGDKDIEELNNVETEIKF
jgi:hypothetical protein